MGQTYFLLFEFFSFTLICLYIRFYTATKHEFQLQTSETHFTMSSTLNQHYQQTPTVNDIHATQNQILEQDTHLPKTTSVISRDDASVLPQESNNSVENTSYTNEVESNQINNAEINHKSPTIDNNKQHNQENRSSRQYNILRDSLSVIPNLAPDSAATRFKRSIDYQNLMVLSPIASPKATLKSPSLKAYSSHTSTSIADIAEDDSYNLSIIQDVGIDDQLEIDNYTLENQSDKSDTEHTPSPERRQTTSKAHHEEESPSLDKTSQRKSSPEIVNQNKTQNKENSLKPLNNLELSSPQQKEDVSDTQNEVTKTTSLDTLSRSTSTHPSHEHTDNESSSLIQGNGTIPNMHDSIIDNVKIKTEKEAQYDTPNSPTLNALPAGSAIESNSNKAFDTTAFLQRMNTPNFRKITQLTPLSVSISSPDLPLTLTSKFHFPESPRIKRLTRDFNISYYNTGPTMLRSLPRVEPPGVTYDRENDNSLYPSLPTSSAQNIRSKPSPTLTNKSPNNQNIQFPALKQINDAAPTPSKTNSTKRSKQKKNKIEELPKTRKKFIIKKEPDDTHSLANKNDTVIIDRKISPVIRKPSLEKSTQTILPIGSSSSSKNERGPLVKKVSFKSTSEELQDSEDMTDNTLSSFKDISSRLLDESISLRSTNRKKRVISNFGFEPPLKKSKTLTKPIRYTFEPKTPNWSKEDWKKFLNLCANTDISRFNMTPKNGVCLIDDPCILQEIPVPFLETFPDISPVEILKMIISVWGVVSDFRKQKC